MLSDDQKRAQYDQFGHAGANQGFGGFGMEETSVVASVLKIYLVLSLAVAARRRDPNAPRQGADLQYQVTLDFEEAILVRN